MPFAYSKHGGKEMKKGNTMVFFQKLSKAFLTPLSLIASASLLMGVASFFTSGDIIAAAPFLGDSYAGNTI